MEAYFVVGLLLGITSGAVVVWFIAKWHFSRQQPQEERNLEMSSHFLENDHNLQQTKKEKRVSCETQTSSNGSYSSKKRLSYEVQGKTSLQDPPSRSQSLQQGSVDLVVATLNLQYFASYPKDEDAARTRLQEVFTGDNPPDVICVQEGLANRDVLSAVGYELCVCAAKSGFAQSVYDMVYGDPGTLAGCPETSHYALLCNQLYTKKGSPWQVVDHGAMPISSDLQLKGGGGRKQGKLAIRSMVWVKLSNPQRDGPSVYVMCTHITGGRFEDQYFMQSLVEERQMQVNRIVEFYKNRPNASKYDVGILVGDFNATTVYTPTGAMHGYFASGIATSPGVQMDAKWHCITKEKVAAIELEQIFKEYMISPFTAINEHGWSFAYDRRHVGYTSGFGHTIDHMATSRPLLVRSAEVMYLTNQKFGKKSNDTELPLSDHNSVKTTFSVTYPSQIHTSVFRTEYEFLRKLNNFRACVYLTGYGAKQQYADVDAVVEAVAKPLFTDAECLDLHFGKGKWVACYGGDPYAPDNPDIAVVVKQLQEKYGMYVIAIQADYVERHWGGVDKHIDAVYYYPTEYAPGTESPVWGGFDNGRLVGTTRILLEVNPQSNIPLFWLSAGGGDVASDELQAAYEHGIAITSIPARARFPQDADLPYGPCLQFWESLTNYDTFGEGSSAWRRKKSEQEQS